MNTLGTELDRTIASWGPEAAAALKRSRNKDRFRAAVERTWRLRPEVGRFVLVHTNGIYIAKDERPRRGPDRHKDWWVFGLYLDDAKARTEVDAWQSVLLMNLVQEGFAVDELRFFPAKWDMRQRHLFPELRGEGADAVAPGAALREGEDLKYQDEARALDIVKRAACLVFEDTELAWALLEQVRGASVREVLLASPDEASRARDGRRQKEKRFRLFLYVEKPDEVGPIVEAYSEALRSRARLLGLRLSSIWVRKAPPSLVGRQAFRRTGPSVPLRDEGLRGLEDEAARGAGGAGASGAPAAGIESAGA